MSSRLCLLLLVTITSTWANKCDDVFSNDFWVSLKVNDRCYYTGYPGGPGTSANWTHAEQTCKSMLSHNGNTGRLAIIPNQEAFVHTMRSWLESIFGQLDDNFGWWVGLLQTDTSVEPAGGWHWMNGDGTSVNKTGDVFWHKGQPDDAYAGEDCAGLWYRTVDDSMGIDDVECWSNRWFVCEIAVPI